MSGVVNGFIHRPGVHCDSTLLRDIFEFHNHNLSEPMIFGLGIGLGFLYWKDKRTPFPFVGGRINLLDLTKNLCNNMNVKVNIHETKSRKKAFNVLVIIIKQGFPVMIHVDMPYLKYLQLPLEAHFGGHTVVIAGVNEEENVVYIANTGFETLQTASLTELEEARSSEFKPFPPKNRWFTFEFPAQLTALNLAIPRAISKVTDFMLNSPTSNLGIKGVRCFAEEITSWPEK